jgi:hypothetical protein
MLTFIYDSRTKQEICNFDMETSDCELILEVTKNKYIDLRELWITINDFKKNVRYTPGFYALTIPFEWLKKHLPVLAEKAELIILEKIL